MSIPDVSKAESRVGRKPYSYDVGLFLAQMIFYSSGAVITGRDRIPESGPALLVANHQSFLDPMLVALACPRRQIHYMAKEELFRVPTSRHMMLGLGAFPVDRRGPGKATLAHVLKLLREGRVVCLFAEGTRSKDGRLREFQAGFARLAKKTGAPVIPVALQGSRLLFEGVQGRSLPLLRNILRTPPPRLAVGEPIPAELSVEEISERAHRTVASFLEDWEAREANPPSK